MEKLVGFRTFTPNEEETRRKEIRKLEEKLIQLLERKDYDVVECINLQKQIHMLEDQF